MSRPIVIPQRREESGLRIEKDLFLQTPALIGGGDPRNSAEFRLSSLLGMLRFWWRVAQPGRALLKNVRLNEIRIFGGPASDSSGGKGIFSCWLEGGDATSEVPVKGGSSIWASLNTNHQNNVTRFLGSGLGNRVTAVPVGYVGTLVIQFHPKSREEDRQIVKEALERMLAFGGIGLLSRRGLGSMAGPELADVTWDELVTMKRALILPLASDIEPTRNPHFSKLSAARICKLKADDPLKALGEISGLICQLSGNPSDYLSSQADANRERKRECSKFRIEKNPRRPSPVFVHFEKITENGNTSVAATFLYLPTIEASRGYTSLSDNVNRFFQALDNGVSSISETRNLLAGS